ncbi:MAG: M12 family metallopeptidase [Planctomycetes bacterium]|nr:M12 family metallopeptidase [Planctomycetota bacterium]
MNLSLRSTLALTLLLATAPWTGQEPIPGSNEHRTDARPLRFSPCCLPGQAHDEPAAHSISPSDLAPEAKGKAKLIDGDIITWDLEALALDPNGGPYASTYGATAWPAGLVYYVFGANTTTQMQNAMRASMDELETVADVTFIPRGSEPNYLSIVDASGNSSWIGMIGGSQTVNIYNWNYKYIMEHELLHALGFWHEQSRPDRDTYVQINYANVIAQYAYNFDKNPSASTIGPYDFESIMHYGRTAFTSNGQDTITVLAPNQAMQSVIGNRSYLSSLDAAGLAYIYGAPGGGTSLAVTSPNGGESWNVGDAHSITWDSQGLSSQVVIELSRNGGLDWETLFASTANDGQESWTVTATATTQAMVRVTDASNAAEHDESDAFFTITDARPTITTTLHVTQAKLKLVGPGADQFKIQAMWNDAGTGLGVEGGSTTLTLRDVDTPANTWSLQLAQGDLEPKGTKWSFQDPTGAVRVVFDTAKKLVSLSGKGQTLPFGSSQTLELEIDAPIFDATAQWPADPSYRAGRSTPEGDVFFVRKAQIVRGKTSGLDKVRVEGQLRAEAGLGDPRSGLVLIDIDGLDSTSFDASELVAKGTLYTYKSTTGNGIVKFQIDVATGAFRLDVRNADLTGLDSMVDVHLEVGMTVGETTLSMRGNPFSKLVFP